MALVKITFNSRVWVPTRVCRDVGVCLVGEDVADKLVSGVPILFGTIQNTGRTLSYQELCHYWIDPRDTEKFQYQIEYDDAQLVDTDEPILCEELGELFYPACAFQSIAGNNAALLAAIAALEADVAALDVRVTDLETP